MKKSITNYVAGRKVNRELKPPSNDIDKYGHIDKEVLPSNWADKDL